MRQAIYKILCEALTNVPEDRVYQSGAVDDEPTKPFVVYRFSGTDALPWRNLTRRPARLEVWIHDAPGSYNSIDAALTEVEDAFAEVEQYEHAGERLGQVDFGSRSPDLFDNGFQTITRMSEFTIIGRG